MMVKSKRSKRLKISKVSSNGIDRISKLPDHLISCILSLLPTKNAVATSILSTRWKFLWTSFTNLYFELQPTRHQREFILFMNRVLLLLNAPIQEFSLKLCCYGRIDPSDFFSWISFGFGRTFSKFYLCLWYGKAVDLPMNKIFCNVAVIELIGNIHFKIPASASLCFPSVQSLTLKEITPIIANNSSISFPNLKNMNLSHVRFADEDSIQMFLSSSPVLDDLIIEKSDFDDIKNLIIRIPSLTRLSLEYEMFHNPNKLKIESPALQYLKLVDFMPTEYLPGESLSFLLEAVLDIFFDDDYNVNVENTSIIKFLGRLFRVKFLSTTCVVLKACALAKIPLGFQNLKRLEIMWFDCPDLRVMINSFSKCMDNLESLILKGCEQSSYICSHQSYWSEPLNVPKCLLSRVTTVSISCMIVDCCDQVEFLKYILKNAEVLQVLTIDATHICETKQFKFVKKISLMPRGSRTCQVAFT